MVKSITRSNGRSNDDARRASLDSCARATHLASVRRSPPPRRLGQCVRGCTSRCVAFTRAIPSPVSHRNELSVADTTKTRIQLASSMVSAAARSPGHRDVFKSVGAINGRTTQRDVHDTPLRPLPLLAIMIYQVLPNMSLRSLSTCPTRRYVHYRMLLPSMNFTDTYPTDISDLSALPISI